MNTEEWKLASNPRKHLFSNGALYRTFQYMKTDLENWTIKKVLIDLKEEAIKTTLLQYQSSDSKSNKPCMPIPLQSQQKK